MDLENLSSKELEELSQRALNLASNKRSEEREKLMNELFDLITKRGFDPYEFLSPIGRAKAAKKATAPVKYAHPDNPSLTWTGRGRKPKWLAEAEEAGKDLEEFKI
jgi:DNA-binding protein H-NS